MKTQGSIKIERSSVDCAQPAAAVMCMAARCRQVVSAVSLTILATLSLFLAACGKDHDHASHTANDQWTCSMHPQIILPDPGACPICAMDLIPLNASESAAAGEREYSMSTAAKALAKIETTEAVQGSPAVEVRLIGKIAYDETRVRSLSARFPARIDRLFVDFTGIRVAPDDHLAKIYSPELLSAQSEFLSSLKFSNQNAIAAARDKLRLWNLSPDQIRSLEQSGKATDHIDLIAPIGGIVTHKHIKEGDYVKEGAPLFQIADLSHVWAIFDAYESDLAWLRYGQPVEFTTDATPGETFTGRIAFISPQLDPRTRTAQVRVNADNPSGRLKPGVLARAIVRASIGNGGQVSAPDLAGKWISPMHPEIVKDAPGTCDICGMKLVPAEQLGYVQSTPGGELPILIPASAVLHTGKRSVVYVENQKAARPTYEGRPVTLGSRAGDQYIVTSGIKPGERVVTNGAFKIDSALQILAKPSMMNPGPESIIVPAEFQSQLSALLVKYYEIQSALASDDLDATRKAAAAISALLPDTDLPKEARTVWKPVAQTIDETSSIIAKAGDLKQARVPFQPLSDHLIFALRKFGVPVGAGETYLMFCPMAFGDDGAEWLQPGDKTRNPYRGAMMLECGEQRAKLTQK
jgi:Cu(I)/Ag(I) efflux system membrane fusion protein